MNRPLPLLLVVLSLTLPRSAPACERPPDVLCELVPELTTVRAGAAVGLHFQLSNLPSNPAAAAPLDDLPFSVRVSATASPAWQRECFFWDSGPAHEVVPPEAVVVLDDATSAAADGPTSWSARFEVRLLESAPLHGVSATACGDLDGDGVCERWCTASICLREESPPTAPDASFVEPATCARPGEVVALALTVRRNGYAADRPLTVRVLPRNPSDPVDLFPLDPPEISGAGVVVTGDEATVELSCHVHGPCFVGVVNRFDVTISDGPLLLWSSAASAPEGLGAVRVCDPALALSEVVEIDEASGDGRLSACEEGTLRLQVAARNPSLDGSLTEVRIEQEIPEGLELVGHDLHVHDNPMDSVDPSPADLAAAGTVRVEGRLVIVETDEVEPRYGRGGPPVEVFRDMFEVDLLLAVPAGGLGEGEIVIPGALVTGRLGGRVVEDESAAIRVPVVLEIPREVSPPFSASPLLVRGRQALMSWEGPATPGHEFEVYRGELSELRATNYGRCFASGLSVQGLADPAPPPPGGGWFYLVRAEACGAKGPGGSDSFGRLRPLRGSCP